MIESLRALCGGVAVVAILSTHSFAAGTEGDAQDRAPTGGEVALMVRRAREPLVIETWRRGLRLGGPEVRAAVARVANASRAVALLPDLGMALEKETDSQAAVEEAAAFASMSGPDQDTLLLDAGKRLGNGVLANVGLILARARRSEAIPAYFDAVRPALEAAFSMDDFFHLATRKDSSALAPAAAAALDSGDANLWLAILQVCIDSEAPLQTSLLSSALHHSSSKISGETAWTLALAYAQKPASRPGELLANLATGMNHEGDKVADVDLSIGVELLARTLGREPAENKVWVESLSGSGGSRMDEYETLRTLVQYFAPGERRALKERMARLFPTAVFPDASKSQRVVESLKVDSTKPLAIVRLANGFPRGFVTDAIKVRPCNLANGTILGEAEISYDDLGRPLKINLLRIPDTTACADAMTALFAATLKSLQDFSDPDQTQTELLVLEQGFLSRLEESTLQHHKAVPVDSDDSERARVEPPKRIHFVPPSYPASAKAAREEGKVIVEVIVSREGLITDIHLLKQAPEQFLASAFGSIAQWRYRPALRDGQPVRVYLTIIVEFALK